MSQSSASSPHGARQVQKTEHPVTADDIDFVTSIFARGEAEKLVSRRMAVRDLKDRSKHHRYISRVFDLEEDLERSLLLIECLPQPSRGTHPPCNEFLSLARAVSGETADAERILENAILFEEYALQLLNECTAKNGGCSTGATVSPWVVRSGMDGGLAAPGEDTLCWPDNWAVCQMCRLLGTVSFRDRQGNARRVNDSVQYALHKGRNRYRPSKRRRHSTYADAYSIGKQPEEGDDSGSYSSDYYSDSCDEEGTKRKLGQEAIVVGEKHPL